MRSLVFLNAAAGSLLLAGWAVSLHGQEAASGGGVEGAIHTTRTSPRILALPPEGDAFHFAVFGDRTGGPPEGIEILRQAVADTNLLDPDLVMTVGDLINGYNTTPEWLEQMEEYKEAMGHLGMPWFPVAGNHDVYWRGPDAPEREHEENYEKHFGPLWYWFQHKDCGFIALYTDEGDPAAGPKDFRNPAQVKMSDEQLGWLRGALEEMRDLKHLFVFLHHPRWLHRIYGPGNWADVHRALADAGNVRAVFAGHIHRLHYGGIVDGIEYFALATVGGHIPMEDLALGWVHHLNIVTVRAEGITVATLPVGSVVDPRLFTPEREGEVDQLRGLALASSSGPVVFDADGLAAGRYAASITNPVSRPIEVTLTPEAAGDRWVFEPDHAHVTLAPGESAEIVFAFARAAAGFEGNFAVPGITAQVDYLDDAMGRVKLPSRRQALDSALAEVPEAAFGELDRAARIGNASSALQIERSVFSAADGPFTVELMVNPRESANHAALVSQAEESGFVLSVVDAIPRFKVHAGGDYRMVAAAAPLGNDRWTHIAGVYDGAEVRLYLDGQLAGAAPADGDITRSDLPILIGADPDAGGRPQLGFPGSVDEFRLSRGARYRGESVDPPTRHARDADTVALYHFDRRFGPFFASDTPGTPHARILGDVQVIER